MKDDRVKLAGKPFDLLVYLVEHPGELLTRKVLLEAIWGETTVGEESLTEAISRVRKALGEKGPETLIQTVAGQGYRFLGKVEVVTTPANSAASGHSQKTESPPQREYAVWVVVVVAVIVIAVIAWRSLEKAKKPARTPYDQALQSERTGDDGLAVAQLKQLLTSNPSDAATRLRLAWILYQDGQDDEAAKWLLTPDKAVPDRRSPGVVQLKTLALQAMLNGDLDAAQEQLKLALTSDPDNVETLEIVTDNEIDRRQLDSASLHDLAVFN